MEVQEEVGVARQWMWGAWNVGKEGEFTIPNLTDNALTAMCKATSMKILHLHRFIVNVTVENKLHKFAFHYLL